MRISDWSSDVCSSDLHETNHCPGCGHTHWLIGRIMAECAFSQTALPLESSSRVAGGQMIRTVNRRPVFDKAEHAFAACSSGPPIRCCSRKTRGTPGRQGAPRAGTGCASTCRSSGQPDHIKKRTSQLCEKTQKLT